MSYQVLARKWRPRSFHEMVGQEHVLRALVNALDHERLHHAYLFTGTRGVGKTTIARIFAKSLNCEQGVSSKPCGECAACVEIDEGRFVDLIEVDAASRTKVDETRELLDNVQYTPTRGRYKVYLIDEVHMFSNHSFNALLKTLEEPPPHVKFLLATTDPQKLPVTILSRCLQFNLKRLPPDLIQTHLADVLGRESVACEMPALRELARAADGSMRDALSLLDQAIAFGGGEIRTAEVCEMLGTIERGQVLELLQGLARRDAAAVLAAVERVAQQSPDFSALLAEMLTLLQRIAVLQVVPDALDAEETDSAMLEELAGLMSHEDVQLYYQIGLIGRRDLPLSPDPRSGFEMVLLRMLAFTPAAAEPVAPRPGGGTDGPPLGKTPAAAEPVVAAAPAGQGVAATDWEAIIEAMQLKGMVRQLAVNCSLQDHADGEVKLQLDNAHHQLLTAALQEKLQQALDRYFQHPVRLRIDCPAGAGQPVETPARQQQRAAASRQNAAEQAIAGDETVHALEETFGARVQAGSVRPVQD